jgi:hypothetical protein
MKTKKNYISGSKESPAFDSAIGKTAKSAIAAVKRHNSPDWHDCHIWVVYVHTDGSEEAV